MVAQSGDRLLVRPVLRNRKLAPKPSRNRRQLLGSVSHEKLLTLVNQRVADGRVLATANEACKVFRKRSVNYVIAYEPHA